MCLRSLMALAAGSLPVSILIVQVPAGGRWTTHRLAMPPLLQSPLAETNFTLNALGVAGIFGSEEAMSTMALIPLYQGRRWFGWYITPGSLNIARNLGSLARSHFWTQIFPSTTESPATLFGFDGKLGPRYTAAFSGTEMQTGHLGYLAMERCKEATEETTIPGRITVPTSVALIDLANVDLDHDARIPCLSKFDASLALFPIAVSVVTCVMCALVYDWYICSVILFGMLASGFASIAIGSTKLVLKFSTLHYQLPPADGMLVPVVGEDIVVVVKGSEDAVRTIAKGRFELDFDSSLSQDAIGICSLFLIVTFLGQLLLIPQGTLFGQIMFVTSLCVSWVYMFHMSSFKRATLLADILFQTLGDPQIRKFLLGTRTTMTVFVTLLLFHGVSDSSKSPDAVQKILHTFLPNDTPVWKKWKEKVTRQVCDKSLSCLKLDDEDDEKGFSESEKVLLDTLLRDASAAYEGYLQYLEPEQG